MIIHTCPEYRLNLDGECLICKLEKHCDELEEENLYLQDRVNFLDSLIEHGVDNWSGYSESYKEYKLNKAMEIK
jgi:hypothetical protein